METNNQDQPSEPINDRSAQESRPSPGQPNPRPRTMLIRYGKMGNIGLFRHNERTIPPLARYVVIKTERGLELGEIISPFFHHRGRIDMPAEKIEAYCRKSGPDYPLSQSGKVVRFATDQDLNEKKHLDLNCRKELEYCQQLIDEMKLTMKLVDVEHLFGGDRIIFYFMADGRVDFRELVKQLAQQYQTRIEMRQVGARDEAKLVADIETCGRECCCKNFLKVLNPVNMRMAKVQKATLDPSKISGSCGRLKCCLRYEDDIYTEFMKKLPRRNTCVLTDQGVGTVINTEVITQHVMVAIDNGPTVTIPIESIQQFNYKPPDSPEASAPSSAGEQRAVEAVVERPSEASVSSPETASTGQVEPSDTATSSSEESSGRSKKRRRRRRRKKKSPGNDTSSGPGSPGNGSADNSSIPND